MRASVACHIEPVAEPPQELGVTRVLLRIGIASLTFALSGAITTLHQRRTRMSPFPQTGATDKHASNLSTAKATSCKAPPVLPDALKILLDKTFRNWRFPDISDEECETVKQFSGPQAHPELIQGDFDGDGRTDYALLIEQDAAANDRRAIPAQKIYIVAVFNKHGRYRMQVVTDEGGGSLMLMRSGQRDYNYETQREFTYAHDTIFSGFGMGGASYLYENGRFRAIITSD